MERKVTQRSKDSEKAVENNAQNKTIKKIEAEHFPILLSKIEEYKDELGIQEAFVAGLIASYDYTICTIFSKTAEKKLLAQKLKLNQEQKYALYWELYCELTKKYKVDDKNIPKVSKNDEECRKKEKEVKINIQPPSPKNYPQIYKGPYYIDDSEIPTSLIRDYDSSSEENGKKLRPPPNSRCGSVNKSPYVIDRIEDSLIDLEKIENINDEQNSYPCMEKIKPEKIKSNKSKYVDESLETLKQQLGIKIKNQNQAVDDIDNIEFTNSIQGTSNQSKAQGNLQHEKQSILSFDDDEETVKLPESDLMKSTSSIKNTGRSNDSLGFNMNKERGAEEPSIDDKNISLTNEIFGSAKDNSHREINNKQN